MKKMLKQLKKRWQIVTAVLFSMFVLGITPAQVQAWSPINFDQGNLDPSKIKDVGGKAVKIFLMVSIIILVAIVILLGVSIALNNDEMHAETNAKKRMVLVILGIVVVALAVTIVTGLYKVFNPNNAWDSMLNVAFAALG